MTTAVRDQTFHVARPVRAPRAVLVLPFAIGTFVLYGATSVVSLPYERIGFAVIEVTAACLALRSVGTALTLRANKLIAAWVGFVGVYLAASFLQPAWSAPYAFGDMALAVLPLLMMLGFLSRPSWLRNPHGLSVLLVMSGIAALVASRVGVLNGRHDPPSALLIAAVWYFTLQAKTGWIRVAWLAMTGLVGQMAYSSGYRTHVILWAVAPVIILVATRGTAAMVKAVVVVAVAYLLAPLVVDVDLAQALNDSRFQTVVNRQEDVSLQTRFAELTDVLATAGKEWLPGEQVVGYGFGASYQPQASYIVADLGANGRVHNIHIGPALVYFRYGLIGLIIYASMLRVTWRVLRSAKDRCLGGCDRDLVAILAVALILYSLQFLTLNATVEPAMSYCLAGVLAAYCMSKEPVSVTLGPAQPRRAGRWRLR